jgi:hypothetical protein
MSWGLAGWGLSSWGGASLTTLNLLAAFAVRENTVRLVFTMPVYFSKILDQYDASNPLKYSVAAVAESVDAFGVAVRPVRVIAIERPNTLSTPPVAQDEIGYYVDVILDRPMSSYPALYDITCVQLQNTAATSTIVTVTYRFAATHRILQEPSLEMAAPMRDFANPQTHGALAEAATDVLSILASYVASSDGDYAFDEGNTGRKKRVIRRLITTPNGFAHLPGYGLGLLTKSKKLARLDQVGKLATDARMQVEREPDIAKAVVTADFGSVPNLLRLHVSIRPRGGRSQKFTVPVPIR